MQSMTPIASPALILAMLCGCGVESDRAPYYDGRDPRFTERETATGTIGNSATVGTTPLAGDILLLRTTDFDGYLADADGRALYVFANDVPAARTSACVDDCAEAWPAFDAKDISVSEGLSEADFDRFRREDGTWQTQYRGHPLYYFAMDGDTAEVSGDGVGGRWFVARDYFALTVSQNQVIPEGDGEPAPYLTNRLGRTVYAFLNDTPSQGRQGPASACTDGCLDAWPIWPSKAPIDSLVLPSNMSASDFSWFERDVDGRRERQLTFRGYPLYFNTRDDLPGETSGHLTGAWRAISLVFAADEVAAPGTGY